jgi:hypothetical protein
MSDQPVTLAVLAQFYRDVILPDIERAVNRLLDQRVTPRFDAIDQRFAAFHHRFERLETE